MSVVMDPRLLAFEYFIVGRKRFETDPNFRKSESERIHNLEHIDSADLVDWGKFADCIAVGIGLHEDSIIHLYINDTLSMLPRDRQFVSNTAYLLSKLKDVPEKKEIEKKLHAIIESILDK
jgi:hypothetical protein